MMMRMLAAAAALACANLALAQTDTTNKQPPRKGTPPARITAPGKTTQPGKSAEAKLKVGDKAPALKVENWVQGAPVRSFQPGHVYVVEFWATWCPPCQRSIPHLTELQGKHKNLTIIGMASSERETAKGSDRRLPNLERYVRAKGKEMRYTVAYEKDRETYREWMTAAGQSGIPCAFIVGGDGRIAWIGNPLNPAFDAEVEKALHAGADTKKDEKPAKNEKPTESKQPKKDDRK